MANDTKAQTPDQSQAEGASDASVIVIKKYSNRRLYNTQASKYIVLQDVIDLVNKNTNFVIEDAKSGEDITRTILNQIIFEQETQPKAFLFPLEFQKQLIRMYDDAYGYMVPDFLTKSINYFTAERGQMANAWQQMMTDNTEKFLKQSEELAKQNMEIFRKSWEMFGISDAPANEEASAKHSNQDESIRDKSLNNLQDQIDALQKQLKSMK